MPQVRCKICKKEFYIKPSHQKRGWGKYCSISCRTKSQFKGKTVKCFNCGKRIYRSLGQLRRSKSGEFFCNKSCQTHWRNKYFIEEKHANWKNGIRTYRNILERSGRKPFCALCKINDKRILTAHHKDRNRNNNKLSNLVWLCLNCHYLVHHHKDLHKKIMEALV